MKNLLGLEFCRGDEKNMGYLLISKYQVWWKIHRGKKVIVLTTFNYSKMKKFNHKCGIFWHFISYNSTGIFKTALIWIKIDVKQKMHFKGSWDSRYLRGVRFIKGTALIMWNNKIWFLDSYFQIGAAAGIWTLDLSVHSQ